MTTKNIDNGTCEKNETKIPHVYACINAIQAELAKQGISKDRTSKGAGTYKFRGIDDVYNALSPIMARHGLVITPDYSQKTTEVRQSGNGKAMYYTTIKGTFTLISAVDGSRHVCSTYGEAADIGDKSINKAMSIAYKYMCFQVFAIPTQGDNDPDSYVHEALPYQNAVKALPPVDVNSLPQLPYPKDQVQFVAEDGRMYADRQGTRRIFNSDQFTALTKAVLSGEFHISKFQDPNRFYFSQDQLRVLDRLYEQSQAG